jgi:hypothetical protein
MPAFFTTRASASDNHLREPEVEELRPRLREHDIRGLQIAVDDAGFDRDSRSRLGELAIPRRKFDPASKCICRLHERFDLVLFADPVHEDNSNSRFLLRIHRGSRILLVHFETAADGENARYAKRDTAL